MTKLADNSAKHDFVLSENDELLKCISTAQNLIENNRPALIKFAEHKFNYFI